MRSRKQISPAILTLSLAAAAGCQAPPPPSGSVQAASLSSPRLRDTLGMSVDLHANLALLADYGFTRLRTDFTWSDIQRSATAAPSAWSWGPYDSFVDSASSQGMRVLAILDYGNRWANGDRCNEGDDKRPPDDFSTFTRYATETVKHFDGRVAQYEIWNEPNNVNQFWKRGSLICGKGACGCVDAGVDDPSAFGRLAAQTIDTVNRLDLGHALPRITTGGTVYLYEPAYNRSGNDYMNDAFNANPGLAAKLTAEAIHAYTAYPPNSPPESDDWDQGTQNVQLGSKISAARSLYLSHGLSASQPAWITEVGWPTINHVQLNDQAAFTIRTLLLSALDGVEQVYLYNFKDKRDTSFCNADHLLLSPTQYADSENCFGLFFVDQTPKPAATAVKYLMQLLGDYSIVRRVPATDPNHSVYIVQLSNGSDTCYAAWDWAGDKGYQWTVPANFAVYDMFGNEEHVGTAVRLTSSPIYSCKKAAPPPPSDAVFGCNGPGQATESFDGVISYCDDPSGGGEWQCDQFANRVMSSLDYPPVDNWVDNLACEICDLVANDSFLSAHYSVWGPGYRDTSGRQPAKNDLLVWDEPSAGCNEANKRAPGHVAVVTGADSSYIHYVQQNWIINQSIDGSAYASVAASSTAWNTSTWFFDVAGGAGGVNYAPKCWIHPEQSLGPGHNPCTDVAHADNGQYCGTSPQARFQNHALNPNTDANTVYECIDGQVANERRCQAGCAVAGAGVQDDCVTNDPCAQVPASENGYYCGHSSQFYFNRRNTANPSGLYRCASGKTAEYAFCWNDCNVASSGPDSCKQDACANVPSSQNGTYCGNTTQNRFQSSLADQSTVYTCRDGKTVDSVYCIHGCTPAGANHPDVCNDDPCAGVPAASNGVFCGSSPQAYFASSLADQRALYDCQNGRTLWAQSCANGCYVAASGQDDGCR